MSMKIYLDTNIIHGWFRKYIESKKSKIKYDEPEIIRFIFDLENEYIIFNITRTEIFRYLSASWNATQDLCGEVWKDFLNAYKVTFLEVKEIDFDDITEICLIIKTKKKTLINLMHLQIAKKENVWFLTGEKDLFEKYKTYYKKRHILSGFTKNVLSCFSHNFHRSCPVP